MKRWRVPAAMLAAIGVTVVLAACSAPGSGASPGASPAASSTASSAPVPHGEADVMFAQMMIPHHAQAVQMADELLAKQGVAAEVIAVAEQVKSEQAPEIIEMNEFLTSYSQATVDPSASPMSGMSDGMMSQQDMDRLQQADGATASTLFLQQMVTHHRGAIDMARAEVQSGKDPAAAALAKRIITAQQAEITRMQQLLTRE